MMSDALRPSRRGGGQSQAGSVVRAQPVTETSLMESVAGFITEVQAFQQLATATTSSSSSHGGSGASDEGGGSGGKPPQVTWARFETADLNDRTLYPESMEVNGKFQGGTEQTSHY